MLGGCLDGEENPVDLLDWYTRRVDQCVCRSLSCLAVSCIKRFQTVSSWFQLIFLLSIPPRMRMRRVRMSEEEDDEEEEEAEEEEE